MFGSLYKVSILKVNLVLKNTPKSFETVGPVEGLLLKDMSHTRNPRDIREQEDAQEVELLTQLLKMGLSMKKRLPQLLKEHQELDQRKEINVYKTLLNGLERRKR